MQDFLLALLMGPLTAQSQDKKLFMFCFFDSGVPVGKYVSIESVENASAEGVQKSIEDVFGGFVKKWKQASIPVHIAFFLDVLCPIVHLSMTFKQEEHDPLEAV